MAFRPSLAEATEDRRLSNLSVAMLQDPVEQTLSGVFGTVPVVNQSGTYVEIRRDDFIRDEVEERPIGGRPVQVGHRVRELTYLVREYSNEGSIDDRMRANQTPGYDPEAAVVRQITQQQMIRKDRLWATTYFSTAVWGTERVGTSTSSTALNFVQWDQSASVPVDDVLTFGRNMKEETGFRPNVLACGEKVMDSLLLNTQIIDRYVNTQPGIMTKDLVARALGLDRIMVGGLVYDAAQEKANSSVDSTEVAFAITPHDAFLAYVPPSPGLMTPAAGYTFAWTGLLGGGALTAGIWRGRDGRAYTDWFHSRCAYGFGIVDNRLGIFLDSAASS